MSNISDVQPRPLKDLLAEIHRNDTRLPIFQRDYVWPVVAVIKLLGSVGNGYPIGSILRLSTKNGKVPFGSKLFTSSGQSNIDSTFKYMILDGQQRLTSLLHAYYGNGKTLYFIDFKKLHSQYISNPDDVDFEDCIVESSKRVIDRNKYNDITVQQNRWLMPMTALSTGGYYRWVGQVRPNIPIDYNDIFNKYCEQLTDYQIPVITLSEGISIEAICAIFESLNDNGKQLTPFELVNARIYGQSDSRIDLNKKVELASQNYAFIGSNEFSDYTLLQIIALLVTYNRTGTASCKKKDVLKYIQVADIEQYWDKVIEASDFAINILKNDCGLINIKYLPYKSILVPLIATIVQIGLPQKNGPIIAATKIKLVKWYWNVVFAQIYETSTDTRGASDFTQLVDWIDNNKPQPSAIHNDRINQLVLREYDNPRSGIYKGILCLINQQKAEDFYSGDSVDTLDRVDDHHVFPYAFLTSQYPQTSMNEQQKEQYYNCVLNRTLISSRTNNKIRAKSPSNYMVEIQNVIADNNKYQAILRSHLLPNTDLTAYGTDDYELFLNQRQEIIMTEIKRVTGFQRQDDIVAGIKRAIGLQ